LLAPDRAQLVAGSWISLGAVRATIEQSSLSIARLAERADTIARQVGAGGGNR
jgi:hypothetical protein